MKKRCKECDFEADDEEYVFVKFDDGWYCGNCAEVKI